MSEKGIEIVQPQGWPRPKGYANGVAAEGRLVFVGGQVGWKPEGRFEVLDFVGQVRQALLNTVEVLRAAGAAPGHVVRMTWYVKDKKEYLASSRELGAVYREIMGAHYPAMALVQVVDLVEDLARVEIETTAVVPPQE